MSISLETVQKIAYLARLAFTPAELPRYHQDMQQIFSLIDQLQAVDTKSISPMAHPQAEEQRTVPDVVTEYDQHQKFQAIAPMTQLDYYLVPQVIE